MSPSIARASLRAWVVVIVSAVVAGAGDGRGHLDNPMLPEGCGSCHVGHGQSNEPMLAKTEEHACYECHGSDERAAAMRAEGKLAPMARPASIEPVFDKLYRHPVERSGDHRPDEQLPQLAAGDVGRHAECSDCHSPHDRGTDRGRMSVPGFTLTGNRVTEASAEYEVCFKCHSDDHVTEGRQRNLRLLMGPTARSAHPVALPRGGPVSPSLTGDATASTLMRCSDCHGNDDENGPRGPHGSNHEGLLVANYDRSAKVDESPYAFELCYNCHSRKSIWNNESFPMHREHILGSLQRRIPGTSCATCHDPHGSLENTHLIRFNRELVSPDDFGRVQFVDLGDRKGECYLMCHGKNHSPAGY